MRRLAVLSFLIALSACGPRATSLSDRAAREGWCDAERAQVLLGRQANRQLGEAVLQATGAAFYEWIPPDVIVTTAFAPRRVRISHDRDLTVTEISCG